jgi:5'-nucleotidase
MQQLRRSRNVLIVGSLLAAASITAFGGSAGAKSNNRSQRMQERIDLQILAINDFHGAIDTESTSFGGTGGAQYLATNLRNAEAAAPGHSITVSAGDLIGATPLISALFHDEPTIEAANLFGLDINAVGNHEFDEGADELLRMANGGSHPVDGDIDGDPFLGADFDFLAANVVVDATGDTLFPPYSIRNFDGVKVAFIGMTLQGTPNIVTPSGVAGLTFNDEVETVNRLVPRLMRQGVRSFVVLLHDGVSAAPGLSPDTCENGLSGSLAEIVPAFHPQVDVVIAGHTNHEFICMVGKTLVTMADNNGRLFTDIDLQLNRATRDIEVVAVDNVPNLRSVPAAPDLQELIDKYKAISGPLENRIIGSITADFPELPRTAAGESVIGRLIADAQLASTAPVGFGEAEVAFMNPGGIRTDSGFVYASSVAGEGDGNVTYGEAFAVQPFGNSLVTMTLSGQQIETLLEQQWGTATNILSVSDGFEYSWSLSAANGDKVDPASITLNGVPVDPAGSYRVTVNSFLADGGDGFAVLREGTNRLGGALDVDSMEAYLVANSPVTPDLVDRITQVP